MERPVTVTKKSNAALKQHLLTEDDLNNIALFALCTGLDPERQEKLEACDCRSCKCASVVLRLVGDRMLLIMEAEGATKN
jgi:hypothetical protein